MSDLEENKITEEVYEENQTCKICGLEDQPLIKGQTPKKLRKTRKISARTTAKERKDNWIACCVCESWIHTGCAGLTKAEKKKLGGKAFFKCIICCSKVAKAYLIGALDLESNLKEEENKSSRNPESSYTESSDYNTPESVIAFLDDCLDDDNSQKEKEPTIKVTEFSGEKEVTEQRKTERKVKVDGHEIAQLSEEVLGRSDKKVKETEEKANAAKAQKSEKATNIKEEHLTKLAIDKESEEEARKKIIVIDNISNPSSFSDSKKILKEF